MRKKSKIKLAVIGAGNMGSALITGLIRKGLMKSADILAIEKDVTKRRRVQRDLKVRVSPSVAAASSADTILIAVKPQDLQTVLKDLAGNLRHRPLFISIAAGVRTDSLRAALGRRARIIRAMPNLPALVGEGVAGLYAGSGVSAADKKFAAKLFAATGHPFWVRQENLLDAVTALSGSGPAYVFGLMAAMMDGGVALGLPKKGLSEIVSRIVRGSAALALKTGDDPSILRQRVTSRGGTTEAAFKVLERKGWHRALVDAISAAGLRSRGLGCRKP